jgi:hypothetical protein
MILNILFGELVIQIWRAKRDRELAELDIQEDAILAGAKFASS